MPILRARWVLPIAGPPIENGEVVVENDRICEVRPQSRIAGDLIDLGGAILLPGLVNAHSHLEYTALRGFLEDVPFFPWIRTLTETKSRLTSEDWRISAELGALECLAAGITAIGDNADAPATLSAVVKSGLRAAIYQEAFGIDHRQPVEPIVANLAAKVDALRDEANRAGAGKRITIGISPHALYTVRPELLAALRRYADSEGLAMSIHVAESPAESELTLTGRGPFGEMLERRGILWPVPEASPTRYLFDQGILGPRTVAVHCVHQDDSDIEAIAEAGASIVHCPKSNAKLGAGIAPLAKWLAHKRITVGLGTDSAVSNNTLDLFEEMRFALYFQRAAQENVGAVTARDVLQMATAGGARVLGLADRVGVLKAGYQADLTAVRLDRPHVNPATDPYSALIYSARADDVCLTMVAGQVLYRDRAWHTLDSVRIVQEANAIRARLALSSVSNTPKND